MSSWIRRPSPAAVPSGSARPRWRSAARAAPLRRSTADHIKRPKARSFGPPQTTPITA
ncbi:hypothetical protein [Kitasatospora aureofaciens]|uniref:hypothetical protein n=1 Tax=Kitasatospora aureofaciens TaxID=1894 RepID=UPI001C485006|nr:hypothetical protein [Kitasatospora aureofaciens]MBV6701898.1 hypothetical protein [Kitasatospora aureofaciens]